MMDFVEISNLIDNHKPNIDTSLMLNYERVQNGAPKKWLQKN